MTQTAGRESLYPAFPSQTFTSRFEYESYVAEHATQLSDLAEFEARLATTDSRLVTEGTCAPCLRPCSFTSSLRDGTPQPGGRRLPPWPKQSACDCEDRLDGTERALLHFLQARIGVSAWTRLLHVGARGGLHRRLSASVALFASLPALARPPDGPPAHIVLVPRLNPLCGSFADLLAALAPGGSLVFTCRFDPRAIASGDNNVSASGVDAAWWHHGWDSLDRLHEAGFSHPAVHLYRSQELGYLGAGNFVFTAEA